MSGLFLPGDRRTGRRRDSSPAGNGLHGLHKRTALDFDEVVQRAVPSEPLRKPAPFPIGNAQAVMFLGAVDVARHMDQLLGFAGLQVGEQVYLPCPFDGF